MDSELQTDVIICGDNCEVMRKMPSESIDLVVTSPPYDDLRTYGGHSWDFYGVAWNLKRLLKPGGVIVWNVADATKDGSETGTSMRQALHFQSIGLNIHDTMIWEKTNPMPGDGKYRYHDGFEYWFVLSKGRPLKVNLLRDKPNASAGKVSTGGGDRRRPNNKANREGYQWETPEFGFRSNVWVSANCSSESSDHPAPFPEALARDHILSWSNEGDIVLDPFSGSGTTAKMAKHNGRKYIGIEVNPDYVEISKQRLAQGVLF